MPKKSEPNAVRIAPLAYAFATLVAAAGGAQAQEVQQEDNEIIVTARRVEERLIDVPAAISDVSSADVQNSTMSSLPTSLR